MLLAFDGARLPQNLVGSVPSLGQRPLTPRREEGHRIEILGCASFLSPADTERPSLPRAVDRFVLLRLDIEKQPVESANGRDDSVSSRIMS
jgi:hypothetical protein